MPRKPSINTDAPEGWFLAGTHPHQYKAELDRAVFHSGTRSCSVTCIAPKPSGWTTLMQNMTGREYCGKRLRMTCWVRAENVGYISGWLRIDAGEKFEMAAFDNMCNRTVVGTQDWTKQEIVLDVPDDCTNIGFGIIFSGKGKMWADDFAFDIVDKSVPTTSCPCSPGSRDFKAPKNLNFEA